MMQLARFFWIDVPLLVARVSRSAAFAFADGAEFGALPMVGGSAPIAAIALGFLCARLIPGPDSAFTGSTILTCVMLLAGSLAAGAGCWIVVGFALGDLTSGHHDVLAQPVLGLPAVGVSYALLAALVIGVPFSARLLAGSLAGRRRPVLVTGVAALLASVFAYLWSQGAPVLIRPLYTFTGGTPDVSAIAPTQTRGYAFAIAAFAGVIASFWVHRVFFASSEMERWRLENSKRRAAVRAIRVPVGASVVIRALLMSLFLSGMSSSVPESLVLAAILSMILALNAFLGSRSRFVRIVRRIPLWLRYAAASAVAVGASVAIITPWFGSTQGFEPLLTAIVVAMLATAVLFPDARAGAVIIIVAAFCMPAPAYADNCGSLSDCFSAATLAEVAAVAIAAAVLGAFAIAASEAAAAALAVGGEEAVAGLEGLAEAAAGAEELGSAAEAAGEAEEIEPVFDAGDILPETPNPWAGNENCFPIAVSVDTYLGGGELTPVLPTGVTSSIDQLAGYFLDSSLSGEMGVDGAVQAMTDAGDGSRAIAIIADFSKNFSHAINVINSGGQIVAIDGQQFVYGSLQAVSEFNGFGTNPYVWLIPTYP
jgi:hypothetical protein